jgi:predicted nucleotidyltransferase
MDLSILKSEIAKTKSMGRLVTEKILCEHAFCFNGNQEKILDLKEAIAFHFKIHSRNIEIAGSSKLGISLNNARFGQPFGKDSDIDLIVVSSELFDIAWHELLKLDWEYASLFPKDRTALDDCYKALHKGFISSDRLPNKTEFYNNWWKIFSRLSNDDKFEKRKIRGRLFKSWLFVEKYYSIKLDELRNI